MAGGKSCYLLSPTDEGRLCEPNGKVLGICVSIMISEGCLCDPYEKVLGIGVSPIISEGRLCEPRENVRVSV